MAFHLEPPNLHPAERWEATGTYLHSSRGGQFLGAALLAYGQIKYGTGLMKF